MYKVFVDNKVIYITDRAKKPKKGTQLVTIAISDPLEVPVLQWRAELPEYVEVQLVCEEPKQVLKAVFADYDWVEAAGGLVQRKESFLLIHRLGMWDLPKGKIDEGEGVEQAAIREVEEECGIHKPKIRNLITTTYHTYEFRGRKTIKKNYWFWMTYSGNKDLTPQAEEDITAAQWLDQRTVKALLPDAYPSIQDVFKAFWKQKKHR